MMRNFHRLAEGLPVMALMHDIQRQPDLWNQNNLRTSHAASPHREVDDIWLRFQDLEKYKDDSALKQGMLDDHESVNYGGMAALPRARPFIFDLMRMVEGERLGRVMITRLAPGGRIHPHADGGEHSAYYDRYHVVLQGLPGSLFRAEEEQVCMLSGELWWFQNAVEHECINNSADDRIHMIIDVRTLR